MNAYFYQVIDRDNDRRCKDRILDMIGGHLGKELCLERCYAWKGLEDWLNIFWG